MAERVLKVMIVGDHRGLSRSMDQAEGKARRFSGAMGKLGGAMAGAFAGAAIISGIQGFVAEAREAQVVSAQTSAVIKSTGGAANMTAKQFSDLAGAISAKVAVDDEVIQSGENILATFTGVRNETGKGNDVFNQATAAAVDLAAAMNGGQVTAEGLKGANLQLGKALNDPVKGMGALRRVGVAFTAEQKDQIETMVESGNVVGAQKVILGELKTEFGGAAAAAATSGKRLQVAWGNIQEQLGAVLLPILDKVAGWLMSVLPAAISIATGVFGALGAAFRSGSASGTGLTAVFARIGATARTLWDGITALAAGFREGQATSGGLAGAMQLLGAGLRDVAGWIGRNTGLITGLAVALGVALAAVKAWQIASTVFGSVSAAIGGVQTAYRVLIGVQAGVRAAIAGTTVAQSAGTAATMANAVAVYAQTAAARVAAVAARVWAVAQAALNLVLAGNPIALVVVALAALVAGFVVAYRTSATFRAVVAAAWAGIKAAAAATVAWFTGTAWPAIQTVFRAIATAATWLWHTIIQPAFGGIAAVVRVAIGLIRGYWTGVLQPVFRAIAAIAGWLWHNVIAPAFQGIAVAVRVAIFLIRGYWTGVLQPTFRAIATMAGWLWHNVIVPAFKGIGAIIRVVFIAVRGYWTSVLQPTFRAIAALAGWLWHNIIVPAFKGISTIIRANFILIRLAWTSILQPTIRAIAALAGWLWHNVITPAFNGIRTIIRNDFIAIRLLWTSVLQPTFRAIATMAGWLWHTIIQPAMNGIHTAVRASFTAVRAVWTSVLQPTFRAIRAGVGAVRDSFDTAVAGIKSAWSKVKDAVQGPIRFVIDTVINGGLIGAWNWVADTILKNKDLHVDTFKPKGFAVGGRVPGQGPNRDTVPAMLTPGEFVLNRRMVGEAGGLRRLETWRQQSRAGGMNAGGLVQQLAGGGVVGNIGGLNAAFMSHLRMYSDAISTLIHVTSGFRSRAEQADLYRRKPNLAAPPGRSLHELGIAADIMPQLGGTARGRRAGAFGLAFPMSYEPWHIQEAAGRSAAGKGGGFVASLVPDVVKRFAAVTKLLRGTKGIAGAVGHRLIGLVAGKAKDAAGSLFSGLVGKVGGKVSDFLRGRGRSAAENWIIQRESGGSTTADNPTSTAFGLGQLLLGNRRTYAARHGWSPDTTDYGQQLTMFRDYVRERYGTAENAKAFWQCVTLGTVILTRQGWKNHDEVQAGDETLGYNPASGRNEWTAILAVHHYDSAPLIRLSNNKLSLVSTPNHRWVAKHWQREHGRTGKYRAEDTFVETARITSRHALRLSADADTGPGPDITLSEAETLGWIMGDGSVRRSHVVIYQSKTTFIEQLEKTLTEIPHARYIYERKDRPGSHKPERTYYLHAWYARELLARSGYDHKNPVPFVASLDPAQRRAFLRGLFYAEGWWHHTPTGEKLRRLAQADGPQQDAMMLAIYMDGYSPRAQRKPANGNNQAKAVIIMGRPDVGGERLVATEEDPQPVWCVTTELGSWTAMQEGQVFLTGNSHGWYNKGGPVGKIPGMATGGKVGKLSDMGPDAGPQPGYLGGSAFTTAHLLSRMPVAQRARMMRLFGAPTAPGGYQWNKWGRLIRDPKFLGVPDAPATGRFAHPARLKGSAFAVNHLLGRMRPSARSKYLYYNTLPTAPAGYRWEKGRLVIDRRFKGRRARPGDLPGARGSAFTVNDTLSRLAPAYRDAYLRQHQLPSAPAGWRWSAGRLIRATGFKGKITRPQARNAGGAIGGIPVRAFDQGGWLPPRSLTLAANNTSRYEPVGPPGGGRGGVVFQAGAITIPVTAAPGQSEERIAALVDERLAGGLGRVLGHVRARRAR